MSARKVLFIGLDYHGYTTAIIDEMRRAGAEVTYVDIQPRSFFFKVLRTLSKGLFARYLEHHHARAIVVAAKQRYDMVVFLQAHQISLENLAELKRTQPQASFVLYNWDSIDNHDYLPQTPFMDRVHTFDRADAEAHGFEYLPLFCVRPIQELSRMRAQPRAVYMVGNIVNPQRYHVVQAFKDYCRGAGLTFHVYLKISPVVYLRLLREGCVPRGVHFGSIATKRFHDLIETSAAVFDFANHQQTGHTMRTMENLCAGKKIITNNGCVRQEDFFSDDRFHVYEGLDFTGVDAFLDRPLADPQATFSAYHIQSFVLTLMGMQDATPRS